MKCNGGENWIMKYYVKYNEIKIQYNLFGTIYAPIYIVF